MTWIIHILIFLYRPHVLIGSTERCFCGCLQADHTPDWCSCGGCSMWEPLDDYWRRFDPSRPPEVKPPLDWSAA